MEYFALLKTLKWKTDYNDQQKVQLLQKKKKKKTQIALCERWETQNCLICTGLPVPINLTKPLLFLYLKMLQELPRKMIEDYGPKKNFYSFSEWFKCCSKCINLHQFADLPVDRAN